MFNFDNLVRNLPDSYKKTKDSNNYKLLEIERLSGTKLLDNLNEIFESNDLEKAAGKTLDFYGDFVGQPRGNATDEQYRFLIKAKVARNHSIGTIDSVVNILAYIFGCNPDKISIYEYTTQVDKFGTIRIDSVPIEEIIKAELSIEQVEEIIRALLPVGITLEEIVYRGTFKFVATESEIETEQTDGSRGFSANETSKEGGTFSLVVVNTAD